MPVPNIAQPGRLTTSRAIIGAFYLQLQQDAGASWLERVSSLFQSDQESETYAWLGLSPALREWIGGRQAKGLREQGLVIRNKKFESTLEIPVDWMRRDKTGQIRIRIAEQAERANGHWAKLLAALIDNGGVGLCYDGQYFYDTDHSEGDSGVQSNLLSHDIVTTTAPTTVEMSTSILNATQALMAIKDDQGEPMNENARRFLVMVPLAFMAPAAAALGSTIIADTVSRTNTLLTLGSLGGFQYDLAVVPRLSWTTKWALFRADGAARALIRQEELPIQMTAQAEGSQVEFEHDAHRYGIKASRAVGYGYWQHAAQVQFT